MGVTSFCPVRIASNYSYTYVEPSVQVRDALHAAIHAANFLELRTMRAIDISNQPAAETR